MINNNLADIVKVDIDIESPVVNSSSFDQILIVGPEPAPVFKSDGTIEDKPALEKVGAYTSLAAVEDAEFDTVGENADLVGVGAAVAFSQNPKPSKVYIAVQQHLEVDAETMSCVAQTTLPAEVSELTAPGEFLCITVPKSGNVSILQNEETFTGYVSAEPENATEKFILIDIGDMGNCVFDIRCSFSRNEKTYAARYIVKIDGDVDGIEKATIQTINLSDYEDIEDTLNRALKTSGWYVICPMGIPENQFETIADWVDAQTKMAAFPLTSTSEYPANFSGTHLRSFSICCKEYSEQKYEDIPQSNLAIHIAWCVRCLNYTTGSETWANKTLNGIEPANLSATEMQRIKDELNASYFTTYASRNITQGGKTCGGEWIDLIRFRDWLQNEIQVDILSLMVSNPKIPFTDEGINLIHNTLISVLKRGQKMGGIAPDEYDEDGNLIPGFVTSVPLASDISAAQKASRKLVDVTFAARIAGAIHMTEIKGSLTYSLD